MNITLAKPDDSDTLTDIAMLAKGYWGYDESFMNAAREELSVSAKKIEASNLFYYCLKSCHDEILAFYCLDTSGEADNNTVELEALFTHPNWMGKGVGQQLFEHACQLSVNMQANALLIQSDPNAVGFYRKMGCEIIGERASGSISGRTLPVMLKTLR